MGDEVFRHVSHADDPRSVHQREQTHALAIEKLRGAEEFLLFTLDSTDEEGCEMQVTGVANQTNFPAFAHFLHEEAREMMQDFVAKMLIVKLFGIKLDGDDD